ncbi:MULTISPECIES: thiamine diphosphokinase [Clostridium]|uniref:Thiamine diphosphokinase n=1 Tax=Clostridium novyi (strain NT) TaxID=386415 RepID=A0Q107_CLONN|nr:MULTISPECIES: thiamine diphosphokinase [Clostridium]ABK60751.1 thiamine pyrophosphokinase [Clostridium novyi NT]KEH85100.1 thiamine pyrophosphokinase [Clostridium novyi A str. NCTC 538]KEH85844.1 thiamine pyrophosphokinase [Clostridium novyi A str. 4540]KEH85889.1 thiamine pyrophosphokinase [Clostridium novyi A str. BKT29909]KEH91904.1 thiamine pyrophosphokinase [Clostridium novyi A str. GD211209]
MKVVIISGGNSPSYTLIKKELRESEYLIAADSGANTLFKYDVFPDYIIGDLDSIKTVALNYYKNRKVSILQYPPEKDYTDTEIAVNKAIDLGATEIVLLGCTGSRIDHLFGNIGMLLKCLKLGVSCVIKDDNNTIFLTETSIKIRGSLGKTFSIIPYSEEISDLTIIGAKYPLNNYKMKIGSAIGISNVFEEEEVKVQFNSGKILIVYPTD